MEPSNQKKRAQNGCLIVLIVQNFRKASFHGKSKRFFCAVGEAVERLPHLLRGFIDGFSAGCS
jgi:hypothetical protein